MKYLLLLLFSFNVFAQQKVISRDIKIDAINPTSTLSASGTYTSNWITVRDFPAVKVSCKSDQEGTMYLEFSDTGTEAAGATKSDLASSLPVKLEPNVRELVPLTKISGDYFRIQVVNGATEQTSFSCTGYFTSQNNLLTSLSNGAVQQDAPALITRVIDCPRQM